jgi:hypothetical protein
MLVVADSHVDWFDGLFCAGAEFLGLCLLDSSDDQHAERSLCCGQVSVLIVQPHYNNFALAQWTDSQNCRFVVTLVQPALTGVQLFRDFREF